MKQLPLLLFLFLAASCSHKITYAPAPQQPGFAEEVFNHGKAALRTTLPDAELAAQLGAEGNRFYNLGLFVRNQSMADFTVFPDSILAFGYNSLGNGVPLKVYAADKFRKRQRQNDIILSSVVIAAAAASIAVLADDVDSECLDFTPIYYVDGVANTGAQWDWAMESTPTLGYVPASDAPSLMSNDGLLRAQTIYPGESVQGVVKIRTKPGFDQKILLKIPVNGVYAELIFETPK